ncbi:hypothetical protein AVEN_109220-1, partial [Araneus ventricosus]
MRALLAKLLFDGGGYLNSLSEKDPISNKWKLANEVLFLPEQTNAKSKMKLRFPSDPSPIRNGSFLTFKETTCRAEDSWWIDSNRRI